MTRKCNIITDSCSDLTQAYCDEHDLTVLHFTYAEAGKGDEGFSGVDDLFVSRTPHEFYDAIRGGAMPMTSQPSQGEMETVFRAAIASGVPTVYLCFSSGISGCYDGACAVIERLKEELGEDIPLHIVDLKIGSTPQSLLIVEAVRQRDAGLTAEELVAWAREARWYVQTIFMVDDLAALRRGGRIPAALAVVGGLIDLKPLLTFALDGSLASVGVARGRKKAMRKMADFFAKNHSSDSYGSDLVAMGNADCPKDLHLFQDIVRKKDDSVVFMETTIGPTIGCHVGPGMMSLCFWGNDRRVGASVSDRIAAEVKGGSGRARTSA